MSREINSFVAESEGLLYLDPCVVNSDQKLLREFHDFSLMSGEPMATILVSDQEHCRFCRKALVLEGKAHPIPEPYCHIQLLLNFIHDTCNLEYLLSTEDTAFEMGRLLQKYTNLLVLGALPFSTFTASYNRRSRLLSRNRWSSGSA